MPHSIEVSDCTKDNIEALKMQLYGATMDDDVFLMLLTDEILEDTTLDGGEHSASR